MSAFWSELDPPIDEEAEVLVLELEREQRELKANLGQMFADVAPIGKAHQDAVDDDLDEIGEDEDDTTSSDGDDMDDDDDVPGMFRIHDNLSPPLINTAAFDSLASTARASSLPAPHGDDSSDSSSSSESSVTVTLNQVGQVNSTPTPSSDPHLTNIRPTARPARMIVGTHIPPSRPGMPQQPLRIAYIDIAGQPVHSGRTNSGTVSPTSRAYIDAALHSPPGEVHLDTPYEDNTNADSSDTATLPQPTTISSQESGTLPEPVSGHLSQYHQMVAAGHIRPSVSSAQIDSLIESMHQAQRAHSARAANPEDHVTALTEATSSNAGITTLVISESDSDSNSTSNGAT